MTARDASPSAEIAIDAALVQDLLRSQHTDLSRLPLGTRNQGWDNVTWRLGDELAVRLPRRQAAADLTPMEHSWLPQLAARLPVPTPVPVRIGQPERHYPWPWAVVRWVEGSPAYRAPLSTNGAHDLGQLLRALHSPAPDQAPRNPGRSRSLIARMPAFEERLRSLARLTTPAWELDAGTARRLYLHAARQRRSALTWTHLDLHGDNILTRGGRVAGLIDWGDAGAGDPATDLGQAMALVGLDHWEALFAGYGFPSTETFIRARVEALSYAVALAGLRDNHYSPHGWHALRDLGVAVEAVTNSPELSPSPLA